ncbi:PIN2/TERF1-interacting telomerase inhibitor 1-like [Aquarana catesbeiana]|uniref:PIN2/TERF1-interacting telomerase inhibitor 1-like n=1 Tax=Aquarana catesbeiana TaxID=8400 RepID=UPI003CC93B4F
MAMLAEPRRKQKWSVDPRNSAWTKDDSKFGQKMLEKMGWSKGKGLGAQEQGSTEHIKVQVKNNTLGLGACNNYEDKWIAHQDDFNQLLAELNDCHGTASSDSPSNDSKKSFSLEEKSKTSKKRVHYMKFAKGKDLSCRSDTDLACIFGKREKRKKSGQDEANADSEESEEKEQETPSPKNEVELSNTVTSSLSVTQYFAKRMAELKKSQSRRTESAQQSAEASPADSSDCSTEPKKKHKKKKPSQNDVDYENESKLVERNEEEYPVHERKKSKSKKNRCEITDGTEEQEEPEQVQEDELKRKKSKNKRNKEALDQIEKKEDTPLPIEDASTEEPKKKKKKKKQKSHD